MKITFISFAVGVLLLFTSCSQLTDYMGGGVIEYNDSIVEIYNAGLLDYVAYDTYYVETAWDFFDNIENRRLTTLTNLEEYKLQLDQIGDYRGDGLLIDAATQNIQDIIDVLSNQYRELLDIYKLVEAGDLDEEGYNARIDEISQEIEIIDNKIIQRMQEDQSRFAERHNYEIETTE